MWCQIDSRTLDLFISTTIIIIAEIRTKKEKPIKDKEQHTQLRRYVYVKWFYFVIAHNYTKGAIKQLNLCVFFSDTIYREQYLVRMDRVLNTHWQQLHMINFDTLRFSS